MKKLAVYDFDGTLIQSPQEEVGKKMWKEKTGQDFPHKGWWDKKESLDTTIFDIKPFPSILKQLNKDNSDKDTHVIILTSRTEKLKPEVENVLKINNIHVDDILLKSGKEDKGDILLKTAIYNPDLEQIDVYDDFANKKEHKIFELTKIKEELPEHIRYNIHYVNNGNISLLESIILDELLKLFS